MGRSILHVSGPFCSCCSELVCFVVFCFLLFNYLPDLPSLLLASSFTLLLARPHPSLILGPSFGSQCGLKVNPPETFGAFSTRLGQLKHQPHWPSGYQVFSLPSLMTAMTELFRPHRVSRSIHPLLICIHSTSMHPLLKCIQSISSFPLENPDCYRP